MKKVDGVINIKDIFAEIVRKIWIILLCVVLGGGALGGYAIVSNSANASEKPIEETEKELTDDEIKDVEEYVRDVRDAAAYEDYLDESILLNVNPYDLYRAELQYVIEASNVTELATLRASYIDYIRYGRLSCDVAADDKKFTENALMDLISTDSNIDTQNTSLSVVNILIYAEDEKQAKQLTKSIKKQMDEYAENLSDVLAEHELKLLAENIMSTVNIDLVNYRYNYNNHLYNLEQEIENAELTFTKKQKELAYSMLGKVLEEDTDEVVEEGDVNVLLYILLGLAAGAVGAIGVIVCVYFFTDNIKTEKETEQYAGVTHLGNCACIKGTVWDKKADSLFYKEKNTNAEVGIEKIVENIKKICKEQGICEITMVGENYTDTKESLNSIVAALKYVKIDAQCVENVCDATNTHIILLECLKKTTNMSVKECIEACNSQEKMLLGYITFSK